MCRVTRDLSSVRYFSVAYTTVIIYKVPEQHCHVYLGIRKKSIFSGSATKRGRGGVKVCHYRNKDLGLMFFFLSICLRLKNKYMAPIGEKNVKILFRLFKTIKKVPIATKTGGGVKVLVALPLKKKTFFADSLIEYEKTLAFLAKIPLGEKIQVFFQNRSGTF